MLNPLTALETLEVAAHGAKLVNLPALNANAKLRSLSLTKFSSHHDYGAATVPEQLSQLTRVVGPSLPDLPGAYMYILEHIRHRALDRMHMPCELPHPGGRLDVLHCRVSDMLVVQ